MKTVVIFTRRNVGMYCLSYIVAMGYKVKVVSDDENVLWLAGIYGCDIVTLETMGEFDFIISVHWHKIIPTKYLKPGKSINVHPCLYLYHGKNPVERFIANKDMVGSVGVHQMTDIVDVGELVVEKFFPTGVVSTYEAFYNIALPFYFKAVDRAFKRLGI